MARQQTKQHTQLAPVVYIVRKLGITKYDPIGHNVYIQDYGGKAVGLSVMAAAGLPIPEGIVIPVSTHIAAQKIKSDGGKVYMTELIRRILYFLKSNKHVSIRSGAAVSMPGMMDTFLDVPKKPSYLEAGIRKVWESWHSERAVAYRKTHNIVNVHGTAVIIQDMVYGDASPHTSGTGVAYSHNPVTGKHTLTGDWAPGVRGDALVGGEVTPQSLRELKESMPNVYAMLKRGVKRMERPYGGPVEVEFTVQEGDLYFLQCRRAKMAKPQKAKKRKIKQGQVVLKGVVGSPGVATGRAFDARQAAKHGPPYILMCEFTSPDDFPVMQHASAIVTAIGGLTCHAVIVARELGIPCIVGCGDIPDVLYDQTVLTVDADRGVVMVEGGKCLSS